MRATYRIRVLRGTTELGALSVDAMRGSWALSRADGTPGPLTSASALPIQFWLGHSSARATLGPGGGFITLSSYGTATFPAGALESTQSVSLGAIPMTPELREDYQVGTTTFPMGPSGDSALVLTAGMRQPIGPVTVRLAVPAAVRSALARGQQAGVYAKVLQTDSLDYFVLQGSTYDPTSSTVETTLEPWVFTDTRRQDGVFEAVLLVGTAPVRSASGSIGAANSARYRSVPSSRGLALSARAAAAACDASAIGLPLDVVFTTSGFGYRTIDGHQRFHYGLDLRASDGTPVYAVAGGIVHVFTQTRGTAVGNYFVELEHDGRTGFSRYMHLTPGIRGRAGRKACHHWARDC